MLEEVKMSLFGKKEKEEIARLNAEMQSLREAMPVSYTHLTLPTT